VTPEQFLYHEAHLLDTQRYEDWLALFTGDATYWVPLEQSQQDPEQTSSLIYDDRSTQGAVLVVEDRSTASADQ